MGAAIGDFRAQPWQVTQELLAITVEKIDETNRLIFMANSKKGTRPPKPMRIPRPHDVDKPKKVKRKATSEELAAFFKQTGGVIYKPSSQTNDEKL